MHEITTLCTHAKGYEKNFAYQQSHVQKTGKFEHDKHGYVPEMCISCTYGQGYVHEKAFSCTYANRVDLIRREGMAYIDCEFSWLEERIRENLRSIGYEL